MFSTRSNFLQRQIVYVRIVVMQRDGKPSVGIGVGLKTKINANIGTSAEVFDPDIEVEKARIAEKYGADTISDLSMGGKYCAILIMEEYLK
jgi:phosphomethylpyrimidine synthase